MPKYQHKPITVEAVQWFKMGDHPNVVPLGINGYGIMYKQTVVYPGDWIITSPNGEISVVKDSEFRETYEEVG
jgi:hypothetical protein